MSRNFPLALALVFGSLIASAPSFAQLTPPAGSAGAGNSAISGVPFGPANPRALSDPSGIGNASLVPPLRSNFGAQTVPSGSLYSSPTSRPGPVTPTYPGASQRIVNAHDVKPGGKSKVHRRSRGEDTTFTGICRGC